LASIFFLLVLSAVLLVLGATEYAAHRRNLARIPVRIHVNGTRGKSSVTRLIAAALNQAGLRTFAKTTGTLPRMLFPDGREYPVYRPGRHANVLEQLRIVSVARRHNADAVVLECMALQPRLQWLSERKLVHATHGIITNAREDHLDVMGPGERDVALALAGMVPRGHKFITAEKRNLDVFEGVCKDRGCELTVVTPDHVAEVSDSEMEGFSYYEHKENVAVVVELCRQLGISRDKAIAGMWKAVPDEGAQKVFEVDFFGRRLYFVNGFAANDPESTRTVWLHSLELFPEAERRIAVFNCRIDRPQRSQQLARAYVDWPQADAVILMGTGTYVLAREATRRGCDPATFIHQEGADAGEVFETIVGVAGQSAVVAGMANIAGPGLELVHFFQNRSFLRQPSMGHSHG